MENILYCSETDKTKYYFSEDETNENIIKSRIGYYFNNKIDPENLFLKFECKFHSVTNDVVNVVIEDEKLVEYFKNLDNVCLDKFKLKPYQTKKYTPLLKKRTTNDASATNVLRLPYDDKTKIFTKNKKLINLENLEKNETIKLIIEVESLCINKIDDSYVAHIELKLKRVLTLKHMPVFVEKEIPIFPFSEEDGNDIEYKINIDSDSSSSYSKNSD